MDFNRGPHASQGPPASTDRMPQYAVHDHDKSLAIAATLHQKDGVVPGLQMNEQPGPVELAMTVKDGKGLRNAELRLICKENGLRSSGVKVELQTRLIDHITNVHSSGNQQHYQRLATTILEPRNSFAPQKGIDTVFPTSYLSGSNYPQIMDWPFGQPHTTSAPSMTKNNMMTFLLDPWIDLDELGSSVQAQGRLLSDSKIKPPLSRHSVASEATKVAGFHMFGNSTQWMIYSGEGECIIFKQSSFYQPRAQVSGTVTLRAMPQHRYTASIIVKAYDNPLMEKLAHNKSMRVMAFCTSDEKTNPRDISFPHTSELRVNGGVVNANLRGVKGKQGSTQPIDITEILRLTPERYENKKFYFAILLVKVVPVTDLVKRLAIGRLIPKASVIAEIQRKAADESLITTSIVLSLRCPLSTVRMNLPCRSIACTHTQCFDATSYLQLQQQGPTWICPICNISAPFDSLSVDEYLRDILENTDQSVVQVTIEPNGKWCQTSNVSSTLNNKGALPNAEVIELEGTTFGSPGQTEDAAYSCVSFATRLPKVEVHSPSSFVDLTFGDEEDIGSGVGSQQLRATDPGHISQNQNIEALRSRTQHDHEELSTSTIGNQAGATSEDPPLNATTEHVESCLSSHDQTVVMRSSHLIPSTSSPEDSLDSDLFSVSDSSEGIEPLGTDEPTTLFLDNLLERLLLGFKSSVQCQLSPSRTGNDTVPTFISTGSSAIEETSGSSRKRNRAAADDDGSDEADQDGFLRPPRKKLDSGKEIAPQKSLACPYLKLDPLKHRNCCVKQLSRIRDVKQHLSRRHTPDRYCQRCLMTSFADEESLDSHVNLNTCLRKDRSLLEGISHEQERQLSKRSKPNLEEKDQWFAIWDILFPKNLFPGASRPSSAYMDTGLSADMRLFREYCSTHGTAILTEQAVADPIWLELDITEEQRRLLLSRVYAQGISRLFDTFQRSNPSPNSMVDPRSPVLRRHGTMRPTPTSTGSFADSGVALESQMSSSETTSQESPFEQTPRVTETIQQPAMAEHPMLAELTNHETIDGQTQDYGENMMSASLMEMPYDYSYPGWGSFLLPGYDQDLDFAGRQRE